MVEFVVISGVGVNRVNFPTLLALQVVESLIVWKIAMVKIGPMLPDSF